MDLHKDIPTSEIKLGLNIAKEAVKLLTTDSEDEKELKKDLVNIDKALKNCDQDLMSYCNRTITRKYDYILFNQLTHFQRITETEWRNLAFAEQFYTMRNLGNTLLTALNLKKFAKGFLAGVKVVGEYAYDKSLENIKNR